MPVWKKKPILLYATYSEGHAEVVWWYLTTVGESDTQSMSRVRWPVRTVLWEDGGDSPLLLDNCCVVEKAFILEMFNPESGFLKYEILNRVHDDEAAGV